MAAVAASYAAAPPAPDVVAEPVPPAVPRMCSRAGRDNAAVAGSSPKSPAPHADRPGEPAGRRRRRHPRRSTVAAVAQGLAPEPGEDVYDARFGMVLPGLHDHHVHLWSSAAALGSVAAGPPRVRTAAELREALHAAAPDTDGWIRAVGYHDSVAGALDRHRLDDIAPPVPVRVQHRSGALWSLNSAALARIGAPDHPDGRFFREDPAVPRVKAPSLRQAELTGSAAFGVTGLTEATPGYGRGTSKHSRRQRHRVNCGNACTAWPSPGPRPPTRSASARPRSSLTTPPGSGRAVPVDRRQPRRRSPGRGALR